MTNALTPNVVNQPRQLTPAERLDALEASVADIKDVLTKIFDLREMPWDVRRVFSELSRKWRTPEVPVETAPKAPEEKSQTFEEVLEGHKQTLRHLKDIEEQREANKAAIDQKFANIDCAEQAVKDSRREVAIALEKEKQAVIALNEARDLQI